MVSHATRQVKATMATTQSINNNQPRKEDKTQHYNQGIGVTIHRKQAKQSRQKQRKSRVFGTTKMITQQQQNNKNSNNKITKHKRRGGKDIVSM